jgi:hypothetical protein
MKDSYPSFIPMLTNGKYSFGYRKSTLVPIAFENPFFSVFQLDDALNFKLK